MQWRSHSNLHVRQHVPTYYLTLPYLTLPFKLRIGPKLEEFPLYWLHPIPRDKGIIKTPPSGIAKAQVTQRHN